MNNETNIRNYRAAITKINLLGIAATIIWTLFLFQKNMKDFLLVSAFFFFLPLLVLAAALAFAIGRSIFHLINLKKDLKQSSFNQSKQRKLFLTALGNLLIYPLVWLLLLPLSSQFRQNQRQNYLAQLKPKVQQQLTDEYRKAGFSNFKLKLGKVDDYTTEGSTDQTVHYLYTEKIGNRTFRSKQEVSVDRDTGKIDDGLITKEVTEDNFTGTNNQEFADITTGAVFFQPELIKQLKQDDRILHILAKPGQTFEPTFGSYNNLSKKQVKELRKMVLANRKRNSPIAGYYALNFNQLAQDKIISYCTSIRLNHPYSKENCRETIKKLKTLNASNLLVGEHQLTYYYHYHHKNESGDEGKIISFWIEHGKISKIKLEDY